MLSESCRLLAALPLARLAAARAPGLAQRAGTTVVAPAPPSVLRRRRGRSTAAAAADGGGEQGFPSAEWTLLEYEYTREAWP